MNVCMSCGYEWEDVNAHWCPKCGSEDFAVEEEEDSNEYNK